MYVYPLLSPLILYTLDVPLRRVSLAVYSLSYY
ncbi:hypothetical protein VP275E431_P0077 [Vibrio phage 275E43-1]|nr:hypothetical protein VP275E431_P0077 [Vibrio phage 275E43-1]